MYDKLSVGDIIVCGLAFIMFAFIMIAGVGSIGQGIYKKLSGHTMAETNLGFQPDGAYSVPRFVGPR